MMQANTLRLGLEDYKVIYTTSLLHFNQNQVEMICDHKRRHIHIHVDSLKRSGDKRYRLLLAEAVDRIIQRQNRQAVTETRSKCLLDSPETVMVA